MESPSAIASSFNAGAASSRSPRPRALGAHPSGAGTLFRLFCTTARACAVQLYDESGKAIATHPMSAAGEGFYEARLAGVGAGALYRFVLDGRPLPDPFARYLPFGVDGPAMVMSRHHHWKNGSGVSRPLREQVIYELHVGTFSQEGTYDGVRARLPYLAALGITAIELMPLAAFPGRRGWGYDGVALFAPFAPYGTPAQLKTLIDEAHGHGLAVFLDVVYNHFGPHGNYLAAYSPEYFTQSIRNAWGDAVDFGRAPMRRLVLDNARYWLTEFRFDGLRLDAIHAIEDPSPVHILADLAREVAAIGPGKLLIAEDERNEVLPVSGFGLHGIWADDFHHHVRVTLTGEGDGYYGAYQAGASAVAEAIRGGWSFQGQEYPPTGRPRGGPAPSLPAEAFVYCIQNHDQIGNRALGDRLCHAVSRDAYCAVSALLLYLPMTPLLFMGQEWAASTPFAYFTDHEPELGRLVSEGRRAEFTGFVAFSDPSAREQIPDPQDEATFQQSRLRWEEREQSWHAEVLEVYRRLLALRREDPVLRGAGRDGLQVEAHGPVLVVRRFSADGDRLLVVNLSPEPAPAGLDPGFLAGRRVAFQHGAGGQGTMGPYQVVIYGARA
jgi:maltooligosyltrehalose trehalohydrolase